MIPTQLLIVPAAVRDAANAELEALGLGPNNLCVPLVGTAAKDDAAPTHYWCEAVFKEGDRDYTAQVAAIVAKHGGTVKTCDLLKRGTQVDEKKTEFVRVGVKSKVDAIVKR